MITLQQSYPPEILERLHGTMLEILDAISDVCERNGISWYLAAGTALGAARHHGFIPWDDDIDVGMMREDYDRFIEIAPRELPERFELLSPGKTADYAPLLSKVCIRGTRFWTDETMYYGLEQGIFVDIWPRDRVSADPVVQKRQARASNSLRAAHYLYFSDKIHARLKGVQAKVLPKLYPVAHHALHAFCTEEGIRGEFERRTRLSPGAKSAGTTCFPSSGFKILPESLFVDCEKLPFEGRAYPVPTPIEDYCRLTYGKNWHQLPPEEKRVNHAPLVLDFGDGVNVFER